MRAISGSVYDVDKVATRTWPQMEISKSRRLEVYRSESLAVV